MAAYKICEHCSRENPVAARFCRHCGARWPEELIRSATKVTPLMERWRQLSHTLTRREVRKLLGEPIKVTPGDATDPAATETWTYEYEAVSHKERRAEGVIAFSASEGRLLSWTEPDWRRVQPTKTDGGGS